MSRKPKKPCAFQGCPKLVEAGETYCKEHKALRNKEYNKFNRDFDHAKSMVTTKEESELLI